MGYAFAANAADVKLLQVDDGESGCIAATPETIATAEYPIARPLFIYVNAKSVKNREVKAFIDFYLKEAGELANEVGYVRLPSKIYGRAKTNIRKGKTGTQFLDDKGEKIHGPLPTVYK